MYFYTQVHSRFGVSTIDVCKALHHIDCSAPIGISQKMHAQALFLAFKFFVNERYNWTKSSLRDDPYARLLRNLPMTIHKRMIRAPDTVYRAGSIAGS